MKTHIKQKANGKYIIAARQHSEQNVCKKVLSVRAVFGLSSETQEFQSLNLMKNTSSMWYCSLTDRGFYRRQQYLIQSLLMFTQTVLHSSDGQPAIHWICWGQTKSEFR
jgi:hypothetical protein